MPEAATCGGCGCACDDIEVTADAVLRTCPLGDAWFAERSGEAPPPLARVDGREAGLDEALDAAAALLRAARMPLVHGLGQASVEAQRVAVGIAEALGGVLDPAEGAAALPPQTVGTSTATLGEVRDRAEVVVVWRADPVATHPRLLPRLRLDRASRAPERTLVVVDDRRSATAEEADVVLRLDAERDFEALWTLRALVADAPLDRDLASHLPLADLERLAERLRGCRNGAIVHGATAVGLALLLLVRDLSRRTHVVAFPLRREGNARGAEDTLAWQTGYPAAVSFARGFPRSSRLEFGAAGLLARREADAALVVAGDPLDELPAAGAHLRAIPTVVVDPRATATADAARVAIAPAAVGVQHPGTVHRMDGVPLPLRAPRGAGRPGDHEVLAALAERLG